MRYVLGFAHYKDDLILIEKTHPTWQRGLLNGIGGHIKQNEKIEDAMAREFAEETGVRVDVQRWRDYRARITDVDCNYVVYVFSLQLSAEEMLSVTSKTDEQVFTVNYKDLRGLDCVRDLEWLVPLCRTNQIQNPMTITVANLQGDT